MHALCRFYLGLEVHAQQPHKMVCDDLKDFQKRPDTKTISNAWAHARKRGRPLVTWAEWEAGAARYREPSEVVQARQRRHRDNAGGAQPPARMQQQQAGGAPQQQPAQQQQQRAGVAPQPPPAQQQEQQPQAAFSFFSWRKKPQ